jgi:AraC family transcriptional regulator, transcriptional activator of pobA
MAEKISIPTYKSINDFLGSFAANFQSPDPNFYCLRLLPNNAAEVDQYKAPHKKDFYFISCITNAGKTEISYETQSETDLQSFLVLQSPGLPYSFYRDASAEGYIIYFKKACLDFFIADFEIEFPFFDLMHTHFYKLNAQRYKQISQHFIDVFAAYNTNDSRTNKLPAIKLLALMYELKNFTAAFKDWENSFMSPAQLLMKRYAQMINN